MSSCGMAYKSFRVASRAGIYMLVEDDSVSDSVYENGLVEKDFGLGILVDGNTYIGLFGYYCKSIKCCENNCLDNLSWISSIRVSIYQSPYFLRIPQTNNLSLQLTHKNQGVPTKDISRTIKV